MTIYLNFKLHGVSVYTNVKHYKHYQSEETHFKVQSKGIWNVSWIFEDILANENYVPSHK